MAIASASGEPLSTCLGVFGFHTCRVIELPPEKTSDHTWRLQCPWVRIWYFLLKLGDAGPHRSFASRCPVSTQLASQQSTRLHVGLARQHTRSLHSQIESLMFPRSQQGGCLGLRTLPYTYNLLSCAICIMMHYVFFCERILIIFYVSIHTRTHQRF